VGDLSADDVKLGPALVLDGADYRGLDGVNQQRTARGQARRREQRHGDRQPDAQRADAREAPPRAREPSGDGGDDASHDASSCHRGG
jgi:hypothetical protein